HTMSSLFPYTTLFRSLIFNNCRWVETIHTDPEADVMIHMLGKTHSSSAISGMNRNRGLPLFLKSSQQPVKSPPLLVEMRQIRFISCRKMRINTGQLHLRQSF